MTDETTKKHCRIFRVSFYTGLIAIAMSVLIIMLIADLLKKTPYQIHSEYSVDQNVFYMKYFIMPYLALISLIIHIICFIVFNVYLYKIISIIGRSAALYISANILTAPVGSIFVFYKVRKLAI